MPAEHLDLETRLQRLEDTESIRTLKSRYHLYVNDTDCSARRNARAASISSESSAPGS
jgi:hypothetical protein